MTTTAQTAEPMSDATIQAWQRNCVKRSEAYHAGLWDGRVAAGNGHSHDSGTPYADERYETSYRIGWMHGYLRTQREIKARHCEQAHAGYFYCEATPNDPCGPGHHPHDGHNGRCAA